MFAELGTRSFIRGSLSAHHSIFFPGSLTLLRSFFGFPFSLVAQSLIAQPVVRSAINAKSLIKNTHIHTPPPPPATPPMVHVSRRARSSPWSSQPKSLPQYFYNSKKMVKKNLISKARIIPFWHIHSHPHPLKASFKAGNFWRPQFF